MWFYEFLSCGFSFSDGLTWYGNPDTSAYILMDGGRVVSTVDLSSFMGGL